MGKGFSPNPSNSSNIFLLNVKFEYLTVGLRALIMSSMFAKS